MRVLGSSWSKAAAGAPAPGRPRPRLVRTLALSLLAGSLVNSARPAIAGDNASMEFFESHIRPLLVERCYECHSTSEANGGLVLESREGWMVGGDTGPAIVPGEPEKSLLLTAIRYKNDDLKMPPKSPLSPAEIAAVEKWISMGAPDPREKAASTKAPTGMSIEEGRTFWSFQPIRTPSLPHVNDPGWLETPIDAFILSRLESAGLTPAPDIDASSLLRRVTYNLIGLPPTPSEIEALLADDSPDAFERVVDRLLASPGYGVRWGRHWLDVARYADSNGLDENLAFGSAWRYRDYVVDALNQDKPFDRFVIEQLAGDLLPESGVSEKTATGFLVLGAKVLAEPDREKLEMDTIDEQLDTIGKTFMGMTIGCVRCHDHKFDPLKQSDYYSLAAIFKSTKTFGDTNTGAIKHWNEFPLVTESERPTFEQLDAQIAEKKNAAAAFRAQSMAKVRAEAKAKAAEYLTVAATFDPMATLARVAELAAPRGLHPRILYSCRLHLEYHPDDPFCAFWHEKKRKGEVAEIEQHYRDLFAETLSAWDAAQKQEPKPAALADGRLEAARRALNDESGFLTVPAKPEFAFDETTLAEYNRLSEEARVLESNAADSPSVMAVCDAAVAQTLPIHIRGNHRNLGEAVPRSFPAVMVSSPPSLPEKQSGRLELAQWLASVEHPLTARVHVNRLWGWHFGSAIVRSTENFGQLGDRPSHPELLDWLASEFMQSGWSNKDFHRLILSSRVYRMTSVHANESAADKDPENHLLWKFHRRRLSAEQLRDAILFVSGRLDTALGGKSVPLRNRQFVFDHTSIDHTRYDSVRRAIYLPIIRNNVYAFFEQFDFPDPTMPTGSRNSTVVAPQALLLLNADLVLESADALARELLASSDSTERVRGAYEICFGRPPNEAETKRALAFVEQMRAGDGTLGDEGAWSLFCQSLMASNEFIYLR